MSYRWSAAQARRAYCINRSWDTFIHSNLSLYRGGIDKKLDAMKAELKADIKDSNNAFT